MANIKAVMFDVGGVLINDIDSAERTEVAKIFEITEENAGKFINENNEDLSKGIITESDFWKSVSAGLGKPVPAFADSIFYDVMKNHMKVNQGTKTIAERLSKSGYITGIISNTEVSHVRYMREVNLFNGFKPTILSCEVGFRKPETQIFQIALERLGLEGKEVAYTDDHERKMDGAKDLGISTHVFRSAATLEKWLNGLGLEF